MEKIIFPRKSALKAIVGAIIVFGTVALIALDSYGIRSLGIFSIVPIIIGAALTKEYFSGD